MLDIHFIRENTDIVKAGAVKKHIKVDIDRLLMVDNERRALRQSLETKRAEQNRRSREVGLIKGDMQNTLLEAMRQLKAGMLEDEERLKEVMEEWQRLMLLVPNVPDISVPDGDGDGENMEIKKWGDITTFDFEPKGHVELMTELGMADFERRAQVPGFPRYLF